METRNLGLLVLNATCDDWENMASIRADVEGEWRGDPIDGTVLEGCVLRLVKEGLLGAHEFRGGAFEPLEAGAVEESAVGR